MTDGAVTDVEATKQTLAAISDAPLSIVIVGIGNADFSAMKFLDDFETRSGVNRDIVQFVQFSAHEFDKTSLTRATLEEIPDQLVQFFYSRGIMPQHSRFSTSKIIVEDYDEETDIDLSMDFGGDGEIVLNGDQSAAYVDNSYEAGLGRLHAMPPPTAPTATVPTSSAPVMAQPVPVPVPQPPQPFTFQVQVPAGVAPGMQIQVQHPQTGQMLIVSVPPGIPPGGIFNVAA